MKMLNWKPRRHGNGEMAVGETGAYYYTEARLGSELTFDSGADFDEVITTGSADDCRRYAERHDERESMYRIVRVIDGAKL